MEKEDEEDGREKRNECISISPVTPAAPKFRETFATRIRVRLTEFFEAAIESGR